VSGTKKNDERVRKPVVGGIKTGKIGLCVARVAYPQQKTFDLDAAPLDVIRKI